MTLGEYLIKARKERGYSQRDLAEKSRVSPAEISRVESGKRLNPAPAVLKALAEALVLDYGALLEMAGYAPKSMQKRQKNLRCARGTRRKVPGPERMRRRDVQKG